MPSSAPLIVDPREALYGPLVPVAIAARADEQKKRDEIMAEVQRNEQEKAHALHQKEEEKARKQQEKDEKAKALAEEKQKKAEEMQRRADEKQRQVQEREQKKREREESGKTAATAKKQKQRGKRDAPPLAEDLPCASTKVSRTGRAIRAPNKEY